MFRQLKTMLDVVCKQCMGKKEKRDGTKCDKCGGCGVEKQEKKTLVTK